MRIHWTRVLIGTLLALAILAPASFATTIGVAFWNGDNLYFAGREASGPDLLISSLQSLLAGPSIAEAKEGIASAIPMGTRLISAGIVNDRVVVDLTEQALQSGRGDAQVERIHRQIAATVQQFFPDLSVAINVNGNPLWSYTPPKPYIEPRPTGMSAAEVSAASGALSGKSITLSPGHGYYWLNTYWTTQRGGNCGNQPEDMHTVQIARYLKIFLQNDGALVKSVRDVDMNASGSGPNGQPWWKQASYVWLWHAGYPASVFASSTGDNPPGSAAHNESGDDIRARPLASDYDNTDIFLSVHTNAYQGNCYGGTCPSGSETFYDTSSEHAAWGAVSQQLAGNVNGGIMAAIQGNVDNIPYGSWTCHGACTKDSGGDYGEIRIPNRAATLTELGFHDSCDRDAPLLEDPFFQSVAMWGMYKGVCDYFGVSPTYGIYGSQYVSDTIPTTMVGGRTISVSITFKNMGVVWREARGFRLGAVGDSDPFAGTRQTISGSIDPNGIYTFTFNMTAPRTSGDYTTDWRMVRDSYAWFGDTLTKTVHVDPPTDNEAPSAPANLTATAPGTTFIDLRWDASTDNEIVTGYNIYRNGTKIKFLAGTTYRDTGLTPGATYTYQVSAMDASSNESALSNSASATTLVDITPPAAPINISAVGITNSRIDVTWTAPWDNLTIVNYKVYRDGALVGSPTGTSFSDTGLASGSTHTYQISAVDQSANESNRSAAVVARTNDLGNTILWSDDMEGYTSQADFQTVWPVSASPGLTWSTAKASSGTHSAEETNAAMNSVHDLTGSLAQISAGTFFEFRYYDPAAATNVRHYGQIRNYSGGGHSGTLQELVCIGSYNSSVNTSYYSGRGAFGGANWVSLTNARKSGWHTMRIDITADTTNPITPGKGLARLSVDGVTGYENLPVVWQPFTCIILGSGSTSTTAGNYYYDDIKYGIQGTVQRTSGPNAVESSAGTVVIAWKTGIDSSSRVDYGLTASYGQSAVNPTATKNHSITLTGLTPGTLYHFKVTSSASRKSDSVSPDYTFNTSATSLPALKALPDMRTSGAYGLVVSSVLPNGFYVQDVDGISGIKVLGTANAALGSLVNVTGTLATSGGERVLQNAIVTPTGTGTPPAPRGLNNKAIGGVGISGRSGVNNTGLLIKTWGRVSEVGADMFWLEDGTGAPAAGGKTGLKVLADDLTLPSVGDILAVTGISGAETTGGVTYPVLRPRSDGDVATIAHRD